VEITVEAVSIDGKVIQLISNNVGLWSQEEALTRQKPIEIIIPEELMVSCASRILIVAETISLPRAKSRNGVVSGSARSNKASTGSSGRRYMRRPIRILPTLSSF